MIGIDEAQFFEDLHDFCREAADRDGKMVIVAGLDGDYLRYNFQETLIVLCLQFALSSVLKYLGLKDLLGEDWP